MTTSTSSRKKEVEIKGKGKDKNKTKEQLLKELKEVRKNFANLEKKFKKFKNIKKELEAEHDKFKGIVSSLSDGLDIIDKNYRICFQNKLLIDRFGDLRGKLCFETYMRRQVPCEFCLLRKAFKTGKTQKVELTAPNGKNYELTSTPFKDIDGKTKVIEIVRDITERKEREEEYKKLMNGMNDTAFVVGFDRKFVDVNDTAVEVLGYSREELLTMGPTDIDPNLSAGDIGLLIEGMKKDDKQVFSTEHKTKDGRIIPVEISSSRIMYNGKPHILSVSRDISKRKEAEAALRRSEEKYRAVFENTGTAVIIIEKNKIISLVNRKFEDLSGFSRDEIEGKKYWTDFVVKEDLKRMQQYHGNRRANPLNAPKHYEFRFINKDKEIKNILIYVDMIPGIEKSIASLLDITDRKKAMEAVQESEERFQTVIENLPHGVLVHDLDGYFTMVNKASYKLTGYTKEELLNMKVGDLDPESISRDDRKHLWVQLKKGGSARFESIHYRKDGSSYPAEIFISAINLRGEPMILGIAHDISERKKALEKLQESEEKFQTVTDNLPQGLFVHDFEGNFVLVNKASCGLTGYTEEELLSMKVSDVDPASQTRDDRQNLWLKMKKGGSKRVESTHYRKDDSTYPAEVYLSAIKLDDVPVILAIAHDITKRVEALEKLSKSEEKYRNLYESITDAFVNTDLNGKILEFNEHYLEMLGYTREEIRKLKSKDLTTEKWHQSESKIEEEQLLKRGYSDVYEKEYIKKDGIVFPVEIRSFLLNDEEGKPQSIWSIVRDISGRKKTEKELRKVERLESLGVLAGGIAHDFNNLLTGILGNISLAQIKEGEDTSDLLEDAKQASIQAKNLTQQLLTFAKGGEPIKGEVSIENIIKVSSGFTLHGSNVKCFYDFSPDLWKVEVDKGQMSQVVDNLVINAKQAMPSGGKIRIKTANIILKKDSSIPLREGKYVKITFSDEGMGIPKNHLSKIFDPYFTTKQRGSGLGLATVFSVIQKHDGYITVESESGKGTTFYIYLPAKEEAKKEEKTKSRVEQYLRGEGKILVMDDEETIRNTLGGILKKLGYIVTLTTRGEEALTEYKKALSSGEPYDVVVLDLTIAGGMGGKKTMEKLLKIDPNVRAIVSSGYSTDPIMAHYDEYGFKAVAVKPYDVDELVKAIRKAFE